VSTLDDLLDGSAARLPILVGRKLFHVDALHAETSDSNDGEDREKPLETIAQGYANCVADRGDVVWVHGGDNRYREDELSVTKDGVTIVGDGWGTEWNRTSSQSGDYVVKIMAKNVTIANMQLSVNGDETCIYIGDGGAAVDANAAMCRVIGCFVRGGWYGASGSEGTTGILVDGASTAQIYDNFLWSWGTAAIDVRDGASRTCYGTQIGFNKITGAGYGIYMANAITYGRPSVIHDNMIWDWLYTVNMTRGIHLNVSQGGVFVCNNRIGCANPTYDAGDLNYWVGNDIEAVEAASEANCTYVGTW